MECNSLFNRVPSVETSNGFVEGLVFKIDKLPTVVVNEILSYFKYEELAPCRLVNHFFKKNVEKRLNDAFMRLGREITDLSSVLKRRLPRKESERKDHPLNRYSEIISAMETRFTLLSMTYKKYMDAGLSCFVPGKVLDLSFDVLNMIRGYVKRNVYEQLNAITVMRDIRDYSTMATEHFDLYIVPLLNKRIQESTFARRSLDNARFFTPLIRSSTSIFSTINFNALPSPIDFDYDNIPNQANINKINEHLDAQNKQIEDMRKLIYAQNNVLLHINDVLNEVTKFIPSNSFSVMIQKMNNSSASLQEMLSSPSTSKNKPLIHNNSSGLLESAVDESAHTSRYSLRSRQNSINAVETHKRRNTSKQTENLSSTKTKRTKKH